MDHDGAPLAALQRRHVPDRRSGAEPTRVLEEDAHADATRDGTGQADRSEDLSGYPADGRILPDANGPALHRANRDALCVGGQERRRVVEAQEEAEEAHGFEIQSEEGSIKSSVIGSSVGLVPLNALAVTVVLPTRCRLHRTNHGVEDLPESRQRLG